MVLTQSKHRLQEDHRKIVEDEDAYFGEEVDDDRPDGNFIQSTVILLEIVWFRFVLFCGFD